MKTKRTSTSSNALPEAALELRVTDQDGVEVGASIWPTLLTATSVTGVVEWHDINVISSFISATGDETPWGQRLLLAWAAVGPTSVDAVPVLGPNQWAQARLTLPDITEPGQGSVKVLLTRGDWTARIECLAQPELATEQEIPLKLRSLDIGSIAVDMFSRMWLGHSWLLGELTEE